MRRASLAAATVLALALPPWPPAAADGPTVHHVYPGDSIQAAVDAARPGDAILLHEGVYAEGDIEVDTPDLVIRGVDRNAVVLDGEGRFRRGLLITAPGVEVSNLTLRHYRLDGVKWDGSGVEGNVMRYRARYLTAYNNGDYGIFAFNAIGGVFEDSYASGHPDSGFYIGGCNPCDAIIQRVVAEHNALGYSGTNAGGNLVIRDSVWRRNGAGIVPNSLTSEPNGPQHDALIEGNLIEDSGVSEDDSPGQDDTGPALGIGIGVAGGSFNLIRNNTVRNSGRFGIVLFPFPSTSDVNTFPPYGNKVTGNAVTGSGLYDLALAAGSGERNCFAGNAAASGGGIRSDPREVETLLACSRQNPLLNVPGGFGVHTAAELVAGLVRFGPRPCTPSRCPVPPPQPTMPDPTEGLPASSPAGITHCVPDAGVHAVCDDGHPTVQEAVDHASPGDAVLIGPGRYHEAVLVRTPRLRIRGLDRNAVVLDGENARGFERAFEVEADDVEVANLTVTGYLRDGVRWFQQRGYLGRYLTVYNVGLYGLYAFGSRGGRFEDAYASGIPDGAFYIGECEPCDAVIQRVTATLSGIGYSGTNASGNIVIQDSLWVDNSAGIIPNSLDGEDLPPQHGIVIRRNTVRRSGNLTAPTVSINGPATGVGIGVAGGSHNLIEDNVVEDSSRYGIGVAPYPETTPNLYRPVGNVIRNNRVARSGIFDLVVALGSGERNCFSGNAAASGHELTSDPPAIETLLRCGYDNPLLNLPVVGGAVSTAEIVFGFVAYGQRGDYRTMPVPPPQPTMPDPTGDLP